MFQTMTHVEALPVRCGDALDSAHFATVRRRAIFECCKWDPQVGDVSVLCPFPLLIEPETWRELAGLAEHLAAETLAAEAEIAARPKLHRRLGLPRAVRRAMKRIAAEGASRGIARVMRFDFHWTSEGWRVTEVNSDVPGGFIESCGFTQLMAEHVPGAAPAGDPAAALAEALRQELGDRAMVAQVHATAYTDDRQVMLFLSARLEAAGLRTCLISPEQLSWTDGRASIRTEWCEEPAAAVVRFFPGEWLINLPRRCGWRRFFSGARTPLCNTATALLTQSKRFPLVWDELDVKLPTWRRLMPETRDPRAMNLADEGWVLKPALGRVGEAIAMPGVTPAKQRRRIMRWARWWPGHWAAQRRFEATALSGPDGPVYPCLGVWVIDGRAAGIYGRLAASPLIDHEAREVAVLVTECADVL
jgi:glutathionylspermidine synthase